jgi:RNA polymerase sigma factor (sigma-70 family)
MTAPNDERDREEQFKALFDRHYPRMFRFYRGYVDHQDAHDLAQEAFIRVYQKFEQYRGEAEWGYLQKVGRNILINWWRDRSAGKRAGTMVHIDDPGFAEPLAAPETADYAEREQRRIRRKRLEEAIRALSPGQQQCIRLQLAGLTYEEIAATLQISMDAVKSRRRDALRFLKAHLKDEPGGIEWPDSLREEE